MRSFPARASVAALFLASTAAAATAQTMGFATLPPGTLNHTTASAVAKVMKDKAGLNVLVQPLAGDQVIVPMVGRGEVEIGITNAPEFQGGHAAHKGLRLIGTAHALQTPFFVRKSSDMQTVADLKGKRVTLGYSAMRVIDSVSRAILATGGLTEKDVVAVPVPNVVRSADAFLGGQSDMFNFAFGAPKVREVDATVGGIRALDVDEKGMDAARKILPLGYLTRVSPGPVFVGVEKPTNVYSFDNVLFTHDKVPDAVVFKFLDTLLGNREELIAVQPALRGMTTETIYRAYPGLPYHPGAVKFYADRKITSKALQ